MEVSWVYPQGPPKVDQRDFWGAGSIGCGNRLDGGHWNKMYLEWLLGFKLGRLGKLMVHILEIDYIGKNIGPGDNQGELSGPLINAWKSSSKPRVWAIVCPMSTTWSHGVCHPSATWLLDTFSFSGLLPFLHVGKAIRLPWQRTLGKCSIFTIHEPGPISQEDSPFKPRQDEFCLAFGRHISLKEPSNSLFKGNVCQFCAYIKKARVNSLVAQWLGLGAFTTTAQIQSLVRELKARDVIRCGQVPLRPYMLFSEVQGAG